ncbi:hypothetical protein [Solimonas variicoloris]|uniref:hypothetical protein n=1 Tax=Solimonas variicoloris TaxID=254408 RepID=UPI00039F8370|nr:hypothetical protein [Solimonas variicoloris]
MTKGWKIAALAVVVGVGTYVGLELLLPHHKTEVTLEGLLPADTVFSGTLQSPADVAAATATPGAAQAGAAETAPSGPAVNTDDAAAPAAPSGATETATAPPAPEAEPAPATEVAAAAPAAAPEPAPAAATEAAPAPAEKPAAAKPAAKARPAPAKKAGADAKRDLNASPWWQSGSGSGLQIVYAGSAAYRRAVVVMGNGPFGDAGSANQHIRVLDANGKRVAGSWEVSANNKAMLLFPVARNGRYQLVVDAGLADAQNRTLGQSLKGSVQVQ